MALDSGREADGARPPDGAPRRDALPHDAPALDAPETCLAHAPSAHRSASQVCDHTRPPGSTPDPTYPGPTECVADTDCTAGENGRCNGNGHDGWRCTYDGCFADDDCAAGSVCQCEGSFRSDANTCQVGNCRTDADCATGYCSPTLGSCGDYTGTIGWFCHTCEDECVEDSDCAGADAGFWGRPYCAFSPTEARWVCQASHCAG
jgi:hypothetical protein